MKLGKGENRETEIRIDQGILTTKGAKWREGGAEKMKWGKVEIGKLGIGLLDLIQIGSVKSVVKIGSGLYQGGDRKIGKSGWRIIDFLLRHHFSDTRYDSNRARFQSKIGNRKPDYPIFFGPYSNRPYYYRTNHQPPIYFFSQIKKMYA